MEKTVYDIVLIVFAIVFFSSVVRDVFKTLRDCEHAKRLIATMGTLVLVGFGGFFAFGFAAEDILKLPDSFEWPVGYVQGVCTTRDGEFVVRLQRQSRVQVYDPYWRFLRGWHVNARGGFFKVSCSTAGHIDVYADQHYVFTNDGDLISTTTYVEGEVPALTDDTSILVPTSPIGWIFTSPFNSWVVAVIGFAGIEVVRWRKRRSVGTSPASTAQ